EGEGCPRLQLHLPQTFPIAGSSALKLAIRYIPCPFPRAAYDPARANLFRRIAAEPDERLRRIFLAQFRIQPEVTLHLAQDDGRAFEQARVSTGCASLLEFLSVSRERLEPAHVVIDSASNRPCLIKPAGQFKKARYGLVGTANQEHAAHAVITQQLRIR